jgi:hypothetical protein
VVLRPQRLIVGTAIVLTVATGAFITRTRTRPEKIKPPTLRYEQTSDAVKVYIHNTNMTWGLRDQRVVIVLVGEQRNILRSYGPDEHNTYEGAPGETIACCLIDTLPPRGDFQFTLWPMKAPVAGVTIDLDGGDKWTRWRSRT